MVNSKQKLRPFKMVDCVLLLCQYPLELVIYKLDWLIRHLMSRDTDGLFCKYSVCDRQIADIL